MPQSFFKFLNANLTSQIFLNFFKFWASYVFFSLAKFIIEFDTTAKKIPCDTIPQKNKIIDATRQPTAIFVQLNIWRLIYS